MYDLFVIGAGPGGYTAAILGAKRGLKTAIAEAGPFGGTCTNSGCIPTKTWAESTHLLEKIGQAKKFGIAAEKASLNMAELNKRTLRVTSRLGKGIEHLLKSNDVTIYSNQAELLGANLIKVGGENIEAKNIIIASGGSPIKPALFNHSGVLTSNEIFSLDELPASLVIVGGGVIGMEMAHIFNTLGSKVSVIEAMERILINEDPQVSGELQKISRKIKFHTSTMVTDISEQDGQLLIKTDGGDELTADKILLTIGRRPNLPAGADSLELNAGGGIKVDKRMQSSQPNIYAIGDVTGEYTLAYTAAKEAEVAVNNICGQSDQMHYDNIPSVIFTNPEIASVGDLSPDEDCKTGTFPVAGLGRARTKEENHGFATIHCDEFDIIKRVTIMGPCATELISTAALAISQNLSVEEFLKPLFPHPTMGELLKEAAEDVHGLCVHR